MNRRIFLDWNATTPPHAEVVAAMQRALEGAWGNPSSVHASGRAARAIVEETRAAVAASVGAHPRDVIFTGGGTEANNLALSAAPALVTSRLEHPSVVRAAEALAAEGRRVEWLPVPASGRIEPDAIAAALARVPRGSTLALMAANHETGVLQPLDDALVLARRAGVRLHVDAVQGWGKVPLPALREADSVALSGHKIRGPKGVGVLVWRGSPALLRPLFRGGEQERGLRPGTADPVAIAGLGAAVARLGDGPQRAAALAPLRDRLEAALAEFADGNGDRRHRLPHVANLALRRGRGDEAVAALDLEGIEISSGSACSAGSAEPSPVIAAMHGDERARASIRVSLGESTTGDDVEAAIAVMLRVLGRQTSSA